MKTIFARELQPEFRHEILPYWLYTIDATDYIPAGSHICMEDGFVKRQVIWREDMRALHTTIKLCGPWPQVKRGRPRTGMAKPVSERVSKLRASRKAAGLCPCCGQLLLNLQ